MIKYFFDTEFIEAFHKPLFGKRRHFIDLISIGIVCEDEREYYALSNEFNPNDADEWVKNNVLIKLIDEYNSKITHGIYVDTENIVQSIKYLQRHYGKSNEQIKNEVMEFCSPSPTIPKGVEYEKACPEFYAYFADYDWVLLCSLFGRMIDLPECFPMYCTDLKQMMDERGLDNHWKKRNCPESKNNHNALADAIWNKNLYEQITKKIT